MSLVAEIGCQFALHLRDGGSLHISFVSDLNPCHASSSSVAVVANIHSSILLHPKMQPPLSFLRSHSNLDSSKGLFLSLVYTGSSPADLITRGSVTGHTRLLSVIQDPWSGNVPSTQADSTSKMQRSLEHLVK
jgi:hypothetical protein